jgi:SAM-dependent methyltransferase
MDSFFDKLLRWMRYGKVIKYIPEGSIVCDIGCGKEGYFLNKLSDRIKYGIGFDEKIKDQKRDKYELRQLKIIGNIPLENEKCDVVAMVAVLEHLSNPQRVLNESFRILKKGGRLILTTPTPLARPLLNFLSFKLKLIDKNEIKDHKNYFWTKNVRKMLLESGFREENIKNSFFEIFLNNLIVAEK